MDDQVHKAFDHLAQTIRKTDNPQDLVWLLLRTGQKGSKPLEKPTARPRQTIPIVAAVFFREMGIDAGDPASWVLSPPRLGGDGKNHTFLAFGDQECEVIWHPDWWLFDRPKKRGA